MQRKSRSHRGMSCILLTTRVRYVEGSWLSSAHDLQSYLYHIQLPWQGYLSSWQWHKNKKSHLHMKWKHPTYNGRWGPHVVLLVPPQGLCPERTMFQKGDQTLSVACAHKEASLLLLQLTWARVSRGNKSCHWLVPLFHSIYHLTLLLGRKSQKSGSPSWEPIDVIQSIQETCINLSCLDLRGLDPSTQRQRTGS